MKNITFCKRAQQMLALTLSLLVFLSIFLLATPTTAYCDNSLDNIDTKVQAVVDSISNRVYKIMRAIICPLCIVGLCLAAFQFLAGGTRGSDKARSIVVACFIALFIVVFSPSIVSLVASTVLNSVKTANPGADSNNPLSGAK